MRGTRARAMRLAVYGEGGSSRFRRWMSETKPDGYRLRIVDHLQRVIGETVRVWWRGRVTADPQRREYQRLKRARRGMAWRLVGRRLP